MNRNIKIGDEIRVDMKKINGPSPYVRLVNQVIKRSNGKPTIITIQKEDVEIAESPFAGLLVGTVRIPIAAIKD